MQNQSVLEKGQLFPITVICGKYRLGKNKSARATSKNYDKIQIFKTNYMYMNINNV